MGLLYDSHLKYQPLLEKDRPFHVKRWNVESHLIKWDITVGVHFSAILLQIYIAAY